MKNLSIRLRVLMVAIVPLALIVTLVMAQAAMTRWQELDAALSRHGQAIARQMAPACEYGVFAGNRAILARLAGAAVREPDVKRVVVTDLAGEVLASASNAASFTSEPTPASLVFLAPIEHSELVIEDFPENQAGQWREQPRRLGWVQVEMSDAATVQRQWLILLEAGIMVLFGLGITAFIAWQLGRGIAEPVIRLTATVQRIRGGALEERVPVESGAELGELERGINAMAEGLAQAQVREQRQAADTLFQEQMRARITLESIGDGVVTTNADGCIAYLNPVAEELTGWTLTTAQGRPLTEVFRVIDERIGQERDYPLHVCLRDGRVLRHETRHSLMRQDGRRFSIQDSAAPIRDRAGQIIGSVVVFHDTTEMQHLASRMAFLATHDSLTGLLNRNEFELRLQQALESARREGRTHAVCYLDLDQFKIVNDTCGHVAGDELLKQLTHRLHGLVRPEDVLARLGGDEFGVILGDCTVETAYEVADGLRRVVRDFRFEWQDRSFEVGVSIGLVPISAASGSMTDVLSAADSACYVAKDLGRNRVHIYQSDDDALARRHGEMQWVQRINDGLAQNRFRLYGQKIVPLGAPGPRFCEILLRLEEAEKPLVPPQAFIPAAERYYLMPAIDRWVIGHALRTIGAQCAGSKPSEALYAINLSGQSLCDEQFADFLIRELEVSGLPPGCLCFEITETAAVANLTRAIEFISRLKAMGCRFALDDFGSGLSSFGYLKNLPVDYLKIAGNFIQDINADPVDFAMVEAINQIGHVMGLHTIAESVENSAILHRLRALGVDYAQGFGVHAPVPLEQLLEE
jgi:diguanylate cyclase (GGDEF)-like protein/PAS domain S-box-containing protein